MAVAPAFEDLLGIGLAAAQKARGELLLDEGDVAQQLMVAAAAMADANVEYASRLYRRTFLAGNEGQQLVERVTDRFKDLTKKPANAASVVVTFTRSGPATQAGVIEAGAVVCTATDSQGKRQEFETAADVAWDALETGAKSVTAVAREAGSAGNVDVGKVAQIVSAIFDSNIAVTNAAKAAGGADEETDAEYIARARAYPQTLVRGTAAAVKLGALGVPGVRICSVRVGVLGVMTVYVADGSGNSNQALVDAVRDELPNWVAEGAVYSVVGGVIRLQNVHLRLTLKRGRATDVEGLVQRAVSDEFLKLLAGDTLYRSQFSTAVQNLDRDQFTDVEVVAPPANVTPSPEEILRPGTIQVSDA